MKKTLAILMAALMLLGLTACSSAPEATTEPAATAEQTEQTAAPAEEKQSYTVGICQLVQHPALDAATQGFKDVLTEQLGDSVTIEEGNASNDIPTCATIVNGFVSSEVDLIMANATPALQAAVAATNTIPILGTSVTEYGVALNISDFSGTVGGNVSGTSDLAPLDQQAAMVKELFPDAKTVGILYCSGEANSVYQANVVKECLEADDHNRTCRRGLDDTGKNNTDDHTHETVRGKDFQNTTKSGSCYLLNGITHQFHSE